LDHFLFGKRIGDISLIGEGEILEQIEELQQENAEGVNLIFLSARRP
jgi:hypothetical protein